jgi:alkanesulfonate monooxygenase SsuD/methylene tetrahydromethanopterin reductase-like flavin-dependent oxidoreductase (luciferase family)
MRVATAILLMPLLHPVQVAEEMATLDAVTGGRAICGVGLGYTDKEFELFKVDRRDRVRRTEEAVELIRALWSGAPIDHHGEFFDVTSDASVVLPVQRPGIPIWMGGGAEASARRAARLGDCFYPPPFVTHAELHRLFAVHDTERLALGRGPAATVPVRRDLYIADSPAEAAARIEPFVNGRTRTYIEWGLGKETEKSAILHEDAVDELNGRLLLGTPQQIADQLNALRADIGMTDFVLRLQWPGMEQAEVLEQLRLFGSQVLPLVR